MQMIGVKWGNRFSLSINAAEYSLSLYPSLIKSNKRNWITEEMADDKIATRTSPMSMSPSILDDGKDNGTSRLTVVNSHLNGRPLQQKVSRWFGEIVYKRWFISAWMSVQHENTSSNYFPRVSSSSRNNKKIFHFISSKMILIIYIFNIFIYFIYTFLIRFPS